MEASSHLISPEQLWQHMQAATPGQKLVVVDCRFELGDAGWGRQAFGAARIPGAVYLSLEEDLSGTPTAQSGRHPLPDPAALAARLAQAGIGDDSLVVAYDQGSWMMAARLWWMLRWLGHEQVRVLDGGMPAWQAAGLPLACGTPVARTPAAFTPQVRDDLQVDVAQVESALGTDALLLVDARAPERYRGEVEPLDPVAGHIPGAVNLPFTAQLEGGRLKPAAQLRAAFQALMGTRDASQIVHTCGSGVSAVVNLLAMEEAGLRGSRLYPGSWSQWCSDPRRPVAKS
ncbi:hypothetical protein AAV94_09760 [Lampropedia cohaerens]|uniref:Rhodanese domain-containing protein n=1 Tax=Lampropedia cohaerens TaxID=1610491 RepID=A0A0U1PYH0_9BURK|nr:sulfurtransferase [Lampropedia cohaerens]KKW67568.1 hypothetical protein AAV94_09760 [Lampropedia cohaerens]